MVNSKFYRFMLGLIGSLAFAFSLPDTSALGENLRVSDGLVVFYPFNEGNGAGVHDYADNGPQMDLTITGSASWNDCQNGIVMSGGRVGTAGSATKVIDTLQVSGQSTFEIWLIADNLTQSGPARMISIGGDASDQNFVLGQVENDIEVRLLHTGKNPNARPRLTTSDNVLTTGLTHIVHTFDGTTERLYIDGIQHPTTVSASGSFSNWDSSDPFSIGNEGSSDRPWFGTVRLVAVYDRALNAADVQQNFLAGATGEGGAGGNEPPQSTNDEYGIIEGLTLAVDAASGLLANDCDPQGDPLNAVLVNDASNGTLTLNADGSFIYTPHGDFIGSEVFTYKANDGNLDGDAAQVTIAVRANRGLFFPPPGEGIAQQDQRSPEALGLNPAIISNLSEKAQRWALWRHGYLVHSEGDFNATQEVKSLRKTFHALTVGAAIRQARVPSVDQKISFWQTELVGYDADATWWHVITQSSGFDYPGCGDSTDYLPGDIWTYSDLNLYHLCQALAKAYGKLDYFDNYDDVVQQAYFDAISLQGWSTQAQSDGIRFVFDLEDMGRLGLLIVARGRWNGMTVIPQWFVEELETRQTAGMNVNYNGCNDGDLCLDAAIFPEAPYGYLTWVNTNADYYPGADPNWAWAIGFGGEMIMWNRRNGIVFAAFDLAETNQCAPINNGVVHIIEANIEGPNPLIINDAPAANEDAYSVIEGNTLTETAASGVLANDSDPDDDDLTAILVNSPTYGTLNFYADGSFSYLPDPNFAGTDQFSYRVEDDFGGSDTATVSLTVNPPPPLPSKQEIIDSMRLVNHYWINENPNPGNNRWARSTYFEGNMAMYTVYPDNIYYDYAFNWAELHGWELNGGDTTRLADNHCAGQTYLDLHAYDPQPYKIEHIKASIDGMVASQQDDDWYWIDALQMAMPVFARLGDLQNDTAYFDKMWALYSHTKYTEGGNGLYSDNGNHTAPPDGNYEDFLWWRDANYDPPAQSPNGLMVYWSRGNGWVIAAHVRTLQHLSAADPHRDEYIQTFQDMAASLKDRQRADGFWNPNLDDPEDHAGKETSGTAFFTYAMAWGINNGLLSEAEYRPVVKKAWNAMVRDAVHSNGKLGYVQRSADSPDDRYPVTYDDTADFGVGAFLLAGSEVAKLAEGAMPVPEAKVVYQAEDALVQAGAIENEHAGYTGTGYVNTDDQIGSYVEFEVDVAAAGEKTLVLRFANGAAENRFMDININSGSIEIDNMPFSGTGSWTSWGLVIFHVFLEKGKNTIQVIADHVNGGPNLDKLEVSGDNICQGDLDADGDVDGADLAVFCADLTGINIGDFAANFGKSTCP